MSLRREDHVACHDGVRRKTVGREVEKRNEEPSAGHLAMVMGF